MPPLTLSVVIPALNEAGRIEAAIESARAEGVEILVADGGSTDGTPERAAQAGARVVSCARGRARQLATGVALASGEALLFLHADTHLPPGFDGSVRTALADPDVVGGAFGFQLDETSPGLRAIEWGVRLRIALLGLPYGDQALFVRRGALEAMGGIPQVPIMEDLDLVQALKRRGRFVLLDAAVVTSARRYTEAGVLATWYRNAVALVAWRLGFDRQRVASWYAR